MDVTVGHVVITTTDHTCRDCGLTIAETTFWRDRHHRSGWKSRCTACNDRRREARAQRQDDAAREAMVAREAARALTADGELSPRVALRERLAARRRVDGGGTVESEIDSMIRRFITQGAKR